jgi:hypothetical protein
MLLTKKLTLSNKPTNFPKRKRKRKPKPKPRHIPKPKPIPLIIPKLFL